MLPSAWSGHHSFSILRQRSWRETLEWPCRSFILPSVRCKVKASLISLSSRFAKFLPFPGLQLVGQVPRIYRKKRQLNWAKNLVDELIAPQAWLTFRHDFSPWFHVVSWHFTGRAFADKPQIWWAQICWASLLQGVQNFFSAAVRDLVIKIGRTLLHEKGVACNIMW